MACAPRTSVIVFVALVAAPGPRAFAADRSVAVTFDDLPGPEAGLVSNDVNACYFPRLAAMMKARGYRFITLEDALMDEAYHEARRSARPRIGCGDGSEARCSRL